MAPTVVQMRRLKTRGELREKSRAWPDMVPPEKIPNFIRAINVEEEMLGLKPLRIEPEKRNQP